MRVAGSEIEGHYAAHAVPDDHRLGELEVLAHPCQIVGEVLHRIALVGLIALAVPAQIHGHDAVAPFGEVLELWGEVGVIAAPPVHQQDRRLPLPRLLVAQGHAVALQLPHVKCSSHPVRGCSSRCNYTEGCAPPPGRLTPALDLGLGPVVEAPAEAVVATDSASVDADYHNGAVFRSTRGSQLRDGSLDDGVIECR